MARQIKCERVHELLSEYIDGSVKPHLSDIIDDHLLTCDRCSEELYSLRKVVNALKSLETIEAPENFLDHVHERIKTVTFFDKVLKSIHSAFNRVDAFFNYDHIKLSFQFIAATIVIIATIFSIREIIKQPSYQPFESKKTEIPKQSDEEVLVPALREETHRAERDRVDFLSKTEESKQQPVITIALVIKDEKSDIPFAPSLEKQREVGKKEVPSSAHEGLSMSDTPQRQFLREKSKTLEDRLIKSDKKKRKGEDVNLDSAASHDEVSLPKLSDALTKVKNLVKSVGGTVTFFSSYDKHTREPLFIEATIPARNFSQFTDKLKFIGNFEEHLPQLPKQSDLSVSVTIQIFSSQK